jgi:hypothetical protein
MPANHGRAGSAWLAVGQQAFAERRTTVAAPKNGAKTQFRSGAEAAEKGRKGGKASGEKRRERKTLKEALLLVLNEPHRDDEGHFTGKTMQDEMISGLLKRAMAGDPRAFEIVRDTIGEKPEENLAIRGKGDFSALEAAFEQMAGDAQ